MGGVLSDTLCTGVLSDIPEIISITPLVADVRAKAICIALSNVSAFSASSFFEFVAH